MKFEFLKETVMLFNLYSWGLTPAQHCQVQSKGRDALFFIIYFHEECLALKTLQLFSNNLQRWKILIRYRYFLLKSAKNFSTCNVQGSALPQLWMLKATLAEIEKPYKGKSQQENIVHANCQKYRGIKSALRLTRETQGSLSKQDSLQ